MHYPVMTERQLVARWKISLKNLRRWRIDNEGPTWHKLIQHVRYHEADVLDFERQSLTKTAGGQYNNWTMCVTCTNIVASDLTQDLLP